MQVKTYPIPAPLLQALVNYLRKKPWEEANNFLVEIQRIADVIDNPGPLPPSMNNGSDNESVPVRK